MPTVQHAAFKNIKSFTHNGNLYKGIREVRVSVRGLQPVGIPEEGKPYPVNMDLRGLNAQFPVSVSVVFRAGHDQMIQLIAEPKAPSAIVYGPEDGGLDKTATISNAKYFSMGSAQTQERESLPTAEGVAHSTDGDALPIAIA